MMVFKKFCVLFLKKCIGKVVYQIITNTCTFKQTSDKILVKL